MEIVQRTGCIRAVQNGESAFRTCPRDQIRVLALHPDVRSLLHWIGKRLNGQKGASVTPTPDTTHPMTTEARCCPTLFAKRSFVDVVKLDMKGNEGQRHVYFSALIPS